MAPVSQREGRRLRRRVADLEREASESVYVIAALTDALVEAESLLRQQTMALRAAQVPMVVPVKAEWMH